MLSHIDSYEIAEWMAFEKAFGPIGPEWRDRALAAIHEQLRFLNLMFGEVNFQDNPAEDLPSLKPPDRFMYTQDDEGS